MWDFYKDTLKKLAGYGAAIIRLDAFAYAPKAPGSHNFMNEPETWDTLEQVRKLAEPYGLTLLPEIHASYEEKIYEKVAGFGYLTYDFFLPGILIDAIEQKDGTTLANWANELIDKDTMLSICWAAMMVSRCWICAAFYRKNVFPGLST